MPSEERVMRAREAVKRALDSVEHQMDNYLPAKGESGRDCERRRLIETMADYMLAFADEGSGIGEQEGSFVEQFRKAVGEDAWLSIPTYLQNWITAKALATHRTGLSQSS